MNIYLIRHGQTDWNIQGKIQGHQDISLNETGRGQAECLANGMDLRPVAQIFSSTQKRAMETASVLGQRQNVDVVLINGLEEVDFGKWEGLNWQQIKEQYPDEYRRWNQNPVEAAPPGGETQLEVMSRCASAVECILDLADKKTDIAIVSHGATLAYVVAYLLRDHPQEEDIIVENASITTIHYSPLTGDFMMLGSNDVAHLMI